MRREFSNYLFFRNSLPVYNYFLTGFNILFKIFISNILHICLIISYCFSYSYYSFILKFLFHFPASTYFLFRVSMTSSQDPKKDMTILGRIHK